MLKSVFIFLIVPLRSIGTLDERKRLISIYKLLFVHFRYVYYVNGDF